MNAEKIWNVSEVNAAVRALIENSLMPFWLCGEVGTLNIHRSGHVYMTLKDRDAQIRAVFFGGAAQATAIHLAVGMSVELFGSLTVYETRGEYQFSARMLRPVGFGDLQRRFEELKTKLAAEGLFAPERKKNIPALPLKIGIVTSPDGAAVRDFLQIINRRFPNLNIKIYPAPVQGRGAEIKLADGIKFFNRAKNVEVIVLTRGGGSIEDLWPFNEEILARAIAASDIPVISAIGHEIDFTIADFVADLRAPTPSAAAELVIGRREELLERLENIRKKLADTLMLCLERLKNRLHLAVGSYVFKEPEHLLRRKQQQLDELTGAMVAALNLRRERSGNAFREITLRLKSLKPAGVIQEKRFRLGATTAKLQNLSSIAVSGLKSRLAVLEGRMNALNPLAVLRRGYAVISDPETGLNVTSCRVPSGKMLRARFGDGSLEIKVTGNAPDQ